MELIIFTNSPKFYLTAREAVDGLPGKNVEVVSIVSPCQGSETMAGLLSSIYNDVKLQESTF